MCVCGGCRTICGWELNIISEGMHMLSTRHGVTQLMLKATQGLPWWSKWLKLHTPNPGAPGLIPGWGTRFHKLQLKHGTTKQMFFKNNTKIQLCVPFPSCVPERRWRTWYLSIFQKWGCEDGDSNCCDQYPFSSAASASPAFFLHSFLFLTTTHILNIYSMSGPLQRTTDSEMNKRKLLPTRNLQICTRGLANRLSETRMITAQMEVGKLHCELKKEAEYSARERIGFWKTSHRI